MAQSETEICNSALIKVGADRIVSLDDATRPAILCKEQYPKLRDELLRSHPWNFATRRIELAQLTTTPIYEWAYEYQLPTDCLRVLRAENDEQLEEYAIEGRKILTDSTTMKIKYISNDVEVGDFDVNFCEALALRLGSDLAWALVQSATLSQMLFQAYEKAYRNAMSFDAQEGLANNQIVASEWFDSRR